MKEKAQSGDDAVGTQPCNQRAALDRVLDLGLFAPLGFALEFGTVVPELAKAGRRQVDFSRSLGRAALRAISRSASAPAPTAAGKAGAPLPDSRGATKVEDLAEDSAVDDYDVRTARDLVAFVPQASTAQVRWMLDREQAGKNRVTVIRALERANEQP